MVHISQLIRTLSDSMHQLGDVEVKISFAGVTCSIEGQAGFQKDKTTGEPAILVLLDSLSCSMVEGRLKEQANEEATAVLNRLRNKPNAS